MNQRSPTVKVLVVDDSAFMRKVIKEMILSEGSIEVVGTARDGIEAVEKAIELKPDLITMDIEMPRKNGIDALREIMIKCKADCPAVLMCSSLTIDGSVEALKALKIGASDFIAKDPDAVGKHDPEFQRQLLAKIRAIGGHRRRMRSQTSSTPKNSMTQEPAPQSHHGVCTKIENWTMPEHLDAIVVGSSTGGPPVLEKIFSNLPATLPVPIIVAQHIPELFSKSLTSRLDNLCPCGAELATHGTCMDTPKIYIAQGGSHIKLTRVAGHKLIARMIDEHPGAMYKPSVDLLFTMAADLFGPKVMAIQLTGMGEDGAIGAKKIKAKGGHVIAQNEKSCVVYGMPRAVIDGGSADAILSPQDIQAALQQICEKHASGDNNLIRGQIAA